MTGTTPLIQPIGIDHVNLKTRDMVRSLAFYQDVLGLRLVRAERDGRGDITFASLRVGDVMIDLQPSDHEWSTEETGLNHVCLLVEPCNLDEVRQRLELAGVMIVKGPISRQGSYGFGQALYLTDPDGHGIEIKHHDYPRINGE